MFMRPLVLLPIFLAAITTAAQAAQAPRAPAPLIEAQWSGVPESFEMTELHGRWDWDEQIGELGPTAELSAELNIRLPATWDLKSQRSGLAHLTKVEKDARTPGVWHLEAVMRTASADASLEFVDERNRVFKLSFTLRSRNRYPYVLFRDRCPGYKVTLEPGVAHGHYLYLVVSCSEFGDNLTLYFARSPDARWVASNVIRNSRARSFEFRFPKEVTSDEEGVLPPKVRHVLDLRTEDQHGHRAEYGVYVSAE